MNSKAHFFISLAKSILRIVGCCIAAATVGSDLKVAVSVIAASFALAEGLGIVEEIFDKR